LKSILIFLALVIVSGAGYLLFLDYNKSTTSVQSDSTPLIAEAPPTSASSSLSPTPAPTSTPTPSPAPTPKSSEINLNKPENGAVFNFEAENNTIDFSWSTNFNAKFFVIEVSTTSDFKKIVESRTVNSNKATIKDLKPQGYFWKVKVFGNKNEQVAISKSNAFNLKVKMQPLPELITPAAEITWSTPSPIEFSWKKMQNALKYRIAIYNDLSQHSEVKSLITEKTSFMWNWQNPKSYYWSVKGLNSKGNVISRSEIRHLNIAGATKDKSPTFVIISPKDDTEVVRDLTGETPEAVNFQWRVTKPLPGPLSLIISSDPEFTNPLTLKNVTKSLVTVPLKKEGIYYWNLSSQSEDGKALELSHVTTFILKSKEGFGPPFRIEPANETKIESTDSKPMKFIWKPSKNAIRYHFVLKKADPKTNAYFIMFEKTLEETTLTTDPLETGSYSWNVYAIDAKEKEVGSDHDFVFGINATIIQMEPPKLKEPVIK